MSTREKFSAGLLFIGLILALLPLTANRSFTVSPKIVTSDILDEKSWFSVDQVAKFVINEDSTIQLIDVRSPQEFMASNIPGSVNIPYNEIFNNKYRGYFDNKTIRNIFYSNGDIDANYAFIITRGLQYDNTYVMKGGLNEWFNTVMNSAFKGERITARENALFETRSRARKLFTEINSLPDSLKLKFIKAKHVAAKKLDGGCE